MIELVDRDSLISPDVRLNTTSWRRESNQQMIFSRKKLQVSYNIREICLQLLKTMKSHFLMKSLILSRKVSLLINKLLPRKLKIRKSQCCSQLCIKSKHFQVNAVTKANKMLKIHRCMKRIRIYLRVLES